MDLIQAVVLGLVQGLTEFLPVSSSGHLILFPSLFGWRDAGAGFTAVIQLGTVLAVLIYFAKDIGTALKDWTKSFSDKEARKTPGAKLAWATLIGTVPIVVAGLLFEERIDTTFRSPTLVAVMLLAVSAVMLGAELTAKRKRATDDIKTGDGIVVGFFQALALVPGTSRSGSTIAGALFCGFDRAAAARFSFLLSVPSVLGSGIYKLIKERHEVLGSGLAPTLVATIVAFVSGYAAIAFLIGFLKRHSTVPFIVYRVALGCAILALASSGRLGA